MAANSDFVVLSPDRERILVVEPKAKVGATRDWATELRRNLLAAGAIPPAPFFLLALPDRFYLWQGGRAAGLVPPDSEFPADEVLRPYARLLTTPIRSLSSSGFEGVIQLWLDDLVTDQVPAGPARDWLNGVGLLDRVRNGLVRMRAAA